MTTTRPLTRVVVVGNGMVGSRFVDDLLSRDGTGDTARFDVTVLGAEEYDPYNRVLLSDVVAGKVDVASLALPALTHERATVHRGTSVVHIDRADRRVLTADGAVHPYDALVLATGSAARVPDVDGIGTGGPLPAGVHALRTLDDAREIVAATVNARTAVVVGAGVLGLEAACGLARRGLAVTVVHGGATVMDRQLAPDAGAVAARTLTHLGVAQRTGARTERVVLGAGRAAAVEVALADGTTETLPADLVVLACGTVPETAAAVAAGLPVDRGVVVTAALASPADARVFAVGDCAQPPEGATGLIAQGWDQSRRLAEHLAAGAAGAAGVAADGADDDHVGGRVRLAGERLSPGRPSMALRLSMNVVTRPAAETAPVASIGASGTADPTVRPTQADDEASRGTDVVRLKAAGLDVVTMGVCGARRTPQPGARTVSLSDPDAGRHVEVVVADGFVVGATCVGAPQLGADLTAAYTRRTPVPADPAHLLVQPVATATVAASDPTHMPDRTTVCRCNGVSKGDIVGCWQHGARSVEDIAKATRATTGCGGCKDLVCGIADWLTASTPAEEPDAPLLVEPDDVVALHESHRGNVKVLD
ncbi:FAD-dependent oxidoreductase [Sanguibacter suaedae]|uniref:NAD(P)/FAD-dependent oxidoreductase n=1 Tax=Sanguibacter suaedae TaxID=2795737 RepID=A0A934MAL0_9MICO|nr:FAD-dependent oxidoreductase [Sanguibacter suaedae]MBI9115720.1 NAD(P)/FAD-dependent oxidoreductase [Sanguibacter suaedae]